MACDNLGSATVFLGEVVGKGQNIGGGYFLTFAVNFYKKEIWPVCRQRWKALVPTKALPLSSLPVTCNLHQLRIWSREALQDWSSQLLLYSKGQEMKCSPSSFLEPPISFIALQDVLCRMAHYNHSCYGPVTFRSALHTHFISFLLHNYLRGKSSHPHFIDDETDAQRGYITCHESCCFQW